MSTIYDSRAFVKKRMEAGMPEGQADTLASENRLLIAEHLATKDDLKAVEKSLQYETALLRSEMHSEFADVRREMAELENRLLFRLGGLMVALLSAFAAFIKFA